MEFYPETPKHERRFLEGKTTPFPGNASLMQYFQQGLNQGRWDSEKTALWGCDADTDTDRQLELELESMSLSKWTFAQLDIISSKMAAVLKHRLGDLFRNQNPDGDLVFGVCLPPSNSLVGLLFAILKVGGAYLPFGSSFPEDEERINRMVDMARPLLIITQGDSSTLAKFESVREKTSVVTMDRIWREVEQLSSFTRVVQPLPTFSESNVSLRTAIILFTWDSFGELKGVRLSHRTILNRLNWQWKQFPLDKEERCCFKTDLTFVDSVAEIFGPLLQGHDLVIFDKQTTDTMQHSHLFIQRVVDHQISRLTIVPSFLGALLTTLEDGTVVRTSLDSVKWWICSGGNLTRDLILRFFKTFPRGKTLCNFYGCTEIMGDVTFETFKSLEDVNEKCFGDNEKGRDKKNPVPLGEPIFNTAIYILDPNLEMVKEEEFGEIFVAGYNLATGYVGMRESPDFIPNPFSNTPGFHRLFRTGDFGCIQRTKNGHRALFRREAGLPSQSSIQGPMR